MTQEINHHFTFAAVCPYCGEEHHPYLEYVEEGELRCEKCGKLFTWTAEIEVEYSTEKAEPDDIPEKTTTEIFSNMLDLPFEGARK